MRRISKRLVVLSGVVAVAAISSVAVAQAGHGRGLLANRLLRNAVHVDASFVRADGTTDTLTIDRGTLTARSTTSITLLRRDGHSVTITLGSTTKTVGAVQVGRPVLVLSRSGTALRVQPPRPPFPAASRFVGIGKSRIVHADVNVVFADGSQSQTTWDRGQVTALTATSLTLHRADGQNVTLNVQVGARITGHLVVNGGADVLSRGGTAFRIFAHAAV